MKSIKILILLGILSFQANYLSAQSHKTKSKEEKKIEKQEAKEEAKKLEEACWHELYALFENKDIVFQGESFSGEQVESDINFVRIYGDSAIIQFADGIGGWQNGIGGYTFTGWIDNYKLGKKKPGKAIDLRITIIIKPGQGFRGPFTIGINALSFDSARIIIGIQAGYMYGFIRSNADAYILTGNIPN